MRILLFLFSLAVVSGCSTPSATATAPAPPAASYAGMWAVTVQDTPLGTVKGDLLLTQADDGSLSGTFTSSGQTLKLTKVQRTDDGLAVSFYYPDYQTDVNMMLIGAANESVLTGKTLGQYLTSASRK